jgi:outer membrane beta-barrel protein
MRAFWKLSIVAGLILSVAEVRAEKMAFPEEELAKESVLPKFDVPDSVRNRTVALTRKLELGAFLGSVSDEPIYKQFQYGFLGSFHLDEVHGVTLSYAIMDPGLGVYAEDLKKVKYTDGVPLDLSKTQGPKSYFLANYQFTAFYGKMSILKNYSMNTHIYGLLGLGTVMYDGLSSLALDFGLGTRFYFLKNLALRFDLKLVQFSGPHPIAKKRSDIASGTLTTKDYDTTPYLLTHITGGLVFLF